MILVLAIIAHIAGAAFYILYGKRPDWFKSSFQRLHLTPPAERNKWTRGDDGYFDQGKSYIVNFGMIAATFAINAALYLFAGVEASGFVFCGIFIAWGFIIRGVIAKDIKVMEKAKTDQMAYLTSIAANPSAVESINPMSVKSEAFKGQTYFFYRNFADIRANVPSGEVEMAPVVTELRDKFTKLASKASGEWWTINRAKGL